MQKTKVTYYCDLCGKEITKYSISYLIPNYKPRKIRFFKNEATVLDLCEDCSNDFVNWMHGRRKLND